MLSVRNIVDSKFVFLNDDSFISQEDYKTISKSLKIQEGDLQLAIVGATMGKVALVPANMPKFVTQRSLATLRPIIKILTSKFFLYFASCSYFQDVLWSNTSYSAQPGIYLNTLSNIDILAPPLSEQKTIAHYLDTKTAQIDRKIHLLTQKATLYDNLKQSLINETVTRGLDKTVPMSDRGIEWLGEVPEHWKMKKLKSFVDIRGRIGFRGYTTADIVLEGEGAISLSPSNIVDNKIILEKCTYLSWKKYNESPEIKIEDGDIVFVKTGSTIGKVALIDKLLEPMTINPQLVVFKTVKIYSTHLFYVMQSMSFLYEIFTSTIGGATQALSQADLGATHIIYPPLPEQKAIADYLDTKTAQIDKIIQIINTQIEKLKELRKTLINDVITGKIKV